MMVKTVSQTAKVKNIASPPLHPLVSHFSVSDGNQTQHFVSSTSMPVTYSWCVR